MRCAFVLGLILSVTVACGDDENSGTDAMPDTGARIDTGVLTDAGVAPDATADAGVDAGPTDAGLEDSGLSDSGFEDAGLVDAGLDDAGLDDSGVTDAGLLYTVIVSTSTGGRVLSSPGLIDCTESGGVCADSFGAGTTVTLTASAAIDFAFDGWDGDCVGQGTIAQLVMDADKNCTANFLGTQGEIALVPPPPSVIPNETEDPTNILIFAEKTSFTLPAGVPFDAHVPDGYGSPHLENTGDLPVGQVVNVYFLHFDPVGGASTNRVATLTFPGRIIALITKTNTLFATDDILGLPGQVVYPTIGTHPDRGLEDGNQDPITLSADRRQLSIEFLTSTSSDQIRIITIPLATPVPFTSSRSAIPGSAPASVLLGATETSTSVTVFSEAAAVTLSAPLATDISVPGVYTSGASLTPSTIPTGTRVASYMVHFDPIGTALRSVEGSLTFTRPILGVIGDDATLDASDPLLGASGTVYPTGIDTGRTMDWGAASDWVRLSEDGYSLRFQMQANTGTDQIRVILAD